ncbi:MAG: phosphotransferase [Nocardioides sp.]
MGSDPEVETPLEGGGLTEVVRVGETVRRAAGPWTPAVQALLRHLESAGFAGAPRGCGTDERGREVLTWVEGEQSSWYPDDDLAAFGHLVRELHDATVGFAAPAGASWQRMVGAPVDGPVMCHNDLSADNAIRTAKGLVLIDWDLAAPGTRVWDLAWAAYRWVPLYDDATCERLDIPVPDRARLRLLLDAYGLDAAGRLALLPTVESRLECLIATARTWGTQGRPGWLDVWRDTGGRQWQAGLAYVRSQRRTWEPAPR